MTRTRLSPWLPVLLAAAWSAPGLAAAEPTRQQQEYFEKKVRPILEKNCFVRSVAFDPRGTYVATANSDATAYLLELPAP